MHLGTLVHVERRADTVAGAVAVVEAMLPQRHARKSVQHKPRRALREHGCVQPNVALQHIQQFSILRD